MLGMFVPQSWRMDLADVALDYERHRSELRLCEGRELVHTGVRLTITTALSNAHKLKGCKR